MHRERVLPADVGSSADLEQDGSILKKEYRARPHPMAAFLPGTHIQARVAVRPRFDPTL
jgi:hypothetical protein